MPLKRWIRAALGAACLALPSGVHAAGLFLPVAPAGVAVEPQGASVAMAGQEQRVQIARQELTAVRHDVENAGAGRLVLNVADGAHFDVVVERTAPTKWGYSLSGRVAGGAGGFVTLVVHGEAVAGSIWTPDAEYELSYLGGGVHALRDVTNAPSIKCGGALPPELPAEHATDQGRADDGSVVDILVFWTPEAEDRYGSSEASLLQIDYLIAWANDAFERSGVFVSLNLVGAEKVDYVEVNSRTDLTRLADSDDGYMDSVHDRRDALGADLIYLLKSRYGGTGRLSGAFSVGGSGSFAHEIGHNFGISHQRAEASSGTSNPTLPYQHGFTTEGCKRTIMSYVKDGCPRNSRRPFYASPWRYDIGDGRPLGVTRFAKERGAGGPADAVLTLNRNRHRVANFRPSRYGSEL